MVNVYTHMRITFYANVRCHTTTLVIIITHACVQITYSFNKITRLCVNHTFWSVILLAGVFVFSTTMFIERVIGRLLLKYGWTGQDFAWENVAVGRECVLCACYLLFSHLSVMCLVKSCVPCVVSSVSCLMCLLSPFQVCECNVVSYRLRNRTITCSTTLSSTHDCPISKASRKSHYIHRPQLHPYTTSPQYTSCVCICVM